MRPSGFKILPMLLLPGIIASAQKDTVPGKTDAVVFIQYREKAYKILLGGQVQQAIKTNGKEYSRKYFEIGLHKTITATYGHHPQTAFSHGLSVEIAPEKNTIFGFKYGAWGVFSLLVLGINGIYYTDFNRGNFKIRPELGFGAPPFKLTFGYNIPTISNAAFKELKSSKVQVTLNILLKAKTIKREER